MSKGDGKIIAIKFTEPLLGDVTGNKTHFTISGKEYEYVGDVNGELIDTEYEVDSVERYGVVPIWKINVNEGELEDLIFTNNQLVLDIPFNPSNIEGCRMWLNANEGLAVDSGLVTQWHDLSGNNNHATALGTARPTLVDNVLNGLPVIRFNGSQGMSYPDLNITTYSVFIVVKMTIPLDIRLIMTHDPMVIGFRPASTDFYIRNGSRMSKYNLFSNSQFNILSLTYGQPNAFFNGVEASYSTNANIGTLGRWIGRRDSGNNMTGDIAEIIVYNRELSNTEREAAETYLSNKYNLSIGVSK